MTFCKPETETVSRIEKAGPFDCCCSHQSVASRSLIVSGLTVDIWSTFLCAKLILSKCLHLWFLLFDCFVCRQTVTDLKRFTGYCMGITQVRWTT